MIFGYMNICEIPCTYTMNDYKLFIIPKNEQDLSVLWREVRRLGINRVEEIPTVEQKKIFYVKNATFGFNGTLNFDVEFMADVIKGHKLNQIIITCDDLDSFVKPSSIYYMRKNKNSDELNTDLLYKKDIIKNFKFSAFEKEINGQIIIGEILRHGIASDLKLHSKLILSFEETEDYSFIYYLCCVVKKFLQIVLYTKDISLSCIELTGKTETHPFSYIGNIHIKSEKINNMNRMKSIEFLIIQDSIDKYFQTIVNDDELYIKHLPTSQEYYSKDILRFLNTYSAFENEYKKLPKEKRKRDSSHLKEIRKCVINELDKIHTKNEYDDIFIKQAKERISQIGTQYGERDRIINAFEMFKRHLDDSIEMFFIKNEFDIKNISNTLSKTRDSIVHNNLDRELTFNELKYINFLEWLTYSMLLERIGLNENLIKIVLGAVFNCNGKYFQYIKDIKSGNESN